MPTLVERLSTKLGPLPTWAWAAIPAGAYVAWSYYQASKEPVIVDETGQPLDTTDTANYGLNTGGMYLPSYGATPSGSSQLPIVQTPEPTNETWFRQASSFLIGEGVTPSDVITALSAYIYGTPETINPTQLNALQRALIRFGAAPDGGFVPKTSAPPAPKVVTVPGAPSNVQARRVTSTTVQISWQRPINNGGSAILGYRIEQRQGGRTISIKTALPTATAIRFTVRQGQWNNFLVYALNSKGRGPAAGQSIKT